MSGYNHAEAVKKAQQAVLRGHAAVAEAFQKPKGVLTLDGLLGNDSPKIDAHTLNHPTQEDVFKMRVAELARSFAPIANAIGTIADDADPDEVKAYVALRDEGISPAGGYSLSQRLAKAAGFNNLLAPHIKREETRTAGLGEVTFDM